MSNTGYDNYRYDNTSRRAVRTDGTPVRPASSGRYSASRSFDDRRSGAGSNPDILYDARGERVRKSKISNEFVKTLLFFVLPYLVINSIIFILVTSTPEIKITIKPTDDYKTTTASFTVSSILPVKNLTVTMESNPVEYTKSGSNYTATVSKNGTFYVEASSFNGMHATAYADVSVLDDTPPLIDDSSCHIEEGILTFKVSDTQSGINWSQVYATDSEGNKILPEEDTNRISGTVYMRMDVDQLELHVFDLVGNERTASVTATTEQITVNGPVVE